jgi:hypothetical protein
MLSASLNYPYLYTLKEVVTRGLPSLSGYWPEVRCYSSMARVSRCAFTRRAGSTFCARAQATK